jgi:hypothetical protein
MAASLHTTKSKHFIIGIIITVLLLVFIVTFVWLHRSLQTQPTTASDLFSQRIALHVVSNATVDGTSGEILASDGRYSIVTGHLSKQIRQSITTKQPFAICRRNCDNNWSLFDNLHTSIPALNEKLPDRVRRITAAATTTESKCAMRRWTPPRALPTTFEQLFYDLTSRSSQKPSSYEVFCFSMNTGDFVYELNEL